MLGICSSPPRRKASPISPRTAGSACWPAQPNDGVALNAEMLLGGRAARFEFLAQFVKFGVLPVVAHVIDFGLGLIECHAGLFRMAGVVV